MGEFLLLHLYQHLLLDIFVFTKQTNKKSYFKPFLIWIYLIVNEVWWLFVYLHHNENILKGQVDYFLFFFCLIG